MRELSIFVDESGDFGSYESHSPYYLLTFVFHDQAESISEQVALLDTMLSQDGFPIHTIHTSPLIRKEGHYYHLGNSQRKALFSRLYYFARKTSFTYQTFTFRKREFESETALLLAMARSLGQFIRDRLEYFQSFDRIVIYYDNGQHQISAVLASVFGALISDGLEIRKVVPSDYRLFQVADFLCTIERMAVKREAKTLSRSEIAFFNRSNKEFSKVLKTLRKKIHP